MRALVVATVGLVAVGAAVGIYFAVGPGSDDLVAVPPPIMPTGAASADPLVPSGFLMADAKSTLPLTEEGLRWERAEGRDLPPLITPCGRPLPSDADRVGGRQVALVADIRWKLERVVVYREVAAAKAAMVELRAALTDCADHPDGEPGVSTRWRFEDLAIGEDAMFVAGQRHAQDRGLPGHYRAILMRQGRTLVMFVDFGQARVLAERSEVAPYERDAATMADKLRSATWN